jgi:DNA polymerase I
MKILILIDSSALLYRFFHALPPLTTPDNQPIQAIYGISNILFKILKEQKPNFVAAALDRPEITFRKEEFKDYKANRPPASNELISQIKKIPEVFENFNIKTFEKPGFEADDIIGTLAEKFGNVPDLKIIILSGDLDMLQLVRDDKIVCQIIRSGMSNTDTYTKEKVIERYGLPPKKLAEYKGIIGDSSDNIPGIKGIGPKTAVGLFKDFETIEGIFDNLMIIKEKVAEKLKDRKEDALLYHKLATIKKDVDISPLELNDLKVRDFDKNKIGAFFNKMGFTSLMNRLENHS